MEDGEIRPQSQSREYDWLLVESGVAPREIVLYPNSTSSYVKRSPWSMYSFCFIFTGDLFVNYHTPHKVSSIACKTIDDNIMS